MGSKLTFLSLILCLGQTSCSPARQGMIRNESGADVVLWPLSGRPSPLTSGASSGPIPYYAHEPQVALIERGNCLYTYPRPDYSALPKGLRNYKPFTAVIRPDMSLAIHLRQKNGIEGPEIVAGGFPLKPTTFCGRRGGG
jgi:hypothetical protein